MSTYQVVLIDKPRDWTPHSSDDLPLEVGIARGELGEFPQLFAALRDAVEFNERSRSENDAQWAVVVEKGSVGKIWQGMRICTPLEYKIAAIWWPMGWEPDSPLDVPRCVCRSQGSIQEEVMTYRRAIAAMEALNRQAMDGVGNMWYVILAVEHEPISRTITYDPAGLQTSVEIRRIHVVQPVGSAGYGDCSHCPARAMDCAWMTKSLDRDGSLCP
ncbi:MAG: hypothetical protein ACUVQK_01750 [Thermogutta sp.]